MLDRNACERRVYRLATLLTGNPLAATKVIEQVVDAQPDLRGLDSAHMDRLTVLRSREIKAATLVSERISIATAEALASLTPQQREAWVLARVYHAPEREIARAMDCSLTATQRHLEIADEAMAQRLGADVESASAALLAFSLALDVPGFYRIEQRRRRHARLAMMIVIAAAAALIISAVLLWWGRPLGQ
jgi:DNA-directed RNA polymerase specialized sigma24 family protein